jgi:hypothetical protein
MRHKLLDIEIAPGKWPFAITDAQGQTLDAMAVQMMKTDADKISLTLQTGQKAMFTRL